MKSRERAEEAPERPGGQPVERVERVPRDDASAPEQIQHAPTESEGLGQQDGRDADPEGSQRGRRRWCEEERAEPPPRKAVGRVMGGMGHRSTYRRSVVRLREDRVRPGRYWTDLRNRSRGGRG